MCACVCVCVCVSELTHTLIPMLTLARTPQITLACQPTLMVISTKPLTLALALTHAQGDIHKWALVLVGFLDGFLGGGRVLMCGAIANNLPYLSVYSIRYINT